MNHSVRRSRIVTGVVWLVFSSLLMTGWTAPSLAMHKNVRRVFFLAGRQPCIAKELVNMTGMDQSGAPVILAYRGAGLAMNAACVWLPPSKLRSFKMGKSAIEEAINLDPTDPEIRFVRFMVQDGTPSFLSYDNRQEDFSMVMDLIRQPTGDVDDQMFRKNVASALAETRFPNAEQQKSIETIAKELDT